MDGGMAKQLVVGLMLEDASYRVECGVGCVTCKGDNGHARCSCRSELTDYLGENPGGNLGTAQANPCCWLTPTGS